MPWVYLDDAFPEHPKVAQAGGDAAWLFVCGLAYANRRLTGGRIPKGILAQLSDRKQPTRLAKRLVDAGLWDDAGDSYLIHDYGTWQAGALKEHEQHRTRNERLSEKARKAANARWHGANGHRSTDAQASAEHVPKHRPSTAQAPARADAPAMPEQCPPHPTTQVDPPHGSGGVGHPVPPDGAGGEEEATIDPDDPAARRRQLLPSEHTPATLDGVCRTLAAQRLTAHRANGGHVTSPDGWLAKDAAGHQDDARKLLEARPDISLAGAVTELGGDHPDDPSGRIQAQLRADEGRRYLASLPEPTEQDRAVGLATIRETKAKLRRAR